MKSPRNGRSQRLDPAILQKLASLPYVLAAGGRRSSTITLKHYKQFLALS